MFVVIYQPTNKTTDVKFDKKGISLNGKWQVDTDEDGNVDSYEVLEWALDRVKQIRKQGGEACLAAILE